MISKLTAAVTALALAAASAAVPTSADARDYRDYRYHRYYHHYDHGDAVAAGAVGLILGLAVGAALSDPGPRHTNCYDNGQYCAPPPGYGPPPSYQGNPNSPPPDYYDRDGGKGAYNDAPDDRRADYDRDYGTAPPREDNSCLRPTQQWDPYSGRYVWVNLRTC
jgi:hypothetical protein